jgi:fatty acid desaturase
VLETELGYKPLENSFLIFLGHNICHYDFTKNRWDIGDLTHNSVDYPILQNSSVIRNYKATIGEV